MRPIITHLQHGMQAPRRWGMFALGIAMLMLIGVIETLSTLREHGAELDAQTEQLRRLQQARHEQAREGKLSPQMLALLAAQANALQPASDLLERAWRPNIGMLRVELTAASHDARLQLEARSMQDVIAYLQWLEEQPAVAAAHLLRSADKDVPKLGKVVEVNIELRWREGTAAPAGMASAHTPSFPIPDAAASAPDQPSGEGPTEERP
jgi:hypothetical protein